MYLEGTEHVRWSRQDKTTSFPTFGNFWLCGVSSGVFGHLSHRTVLLSDTSSEGAGEVYLEGFGVCLYHQVCLSRRKEIVMYYNFSFR